MKILLIAINSKYIHPNLAVRLLKANTAFSAEIKEFTIKDSPEKIIAFVNEGNFDVVGISCYIWNIEIVKNILPGIKAKHVVLGGPEVSYDAEYYLENNLAEFVIKNEGEIAFDKLIKHLNGECTLEQVPNLYYRGGFTFDQAVNLSEIRDAYDLYDNMENKIAYIETSRGCPYHCGYCMASLDNNLRFFDMEKIKSKILLLKSKGAKTFKFLDRTFNANRKFPDLIDFIIENYTTGESYQFEITGDVLKPEYIDYINARAPKNLIRFEIGIQSTNVESNRAVGRIQDNKRLFDNILRIQNAGIIDLHLDLIAGLPYETLAVFEKTFNDCIALRPKELQLGFLKLLKGTNLFCHAQDFGYKYENNAPYEIISNDFLSKDDIIEIHCTENAFDYYYNSGFYKNSMLIILDNEPSAFAFFNKLGRLEIKGELHERFRILDDFIKDKSYYNEFHSALIYDYLNHFSIRPKIWWDEKVSKEEKNKLYREFCEKNPDFSPADFYKYGMTVKLENVTYFCLFKPDCKLILKMV